MRVVGALSANDGGIDWQGQSSYPNVNGTNVPTTSTVSGIPAHVPAALFQSEIYYWTTFNWSFPVPEAGDYDVRLYFAETYWTSPGERIFNVSVEGASPAHLQNIDMYAEAGMDAAIVKAHTVNVNDGTLNISLQPGSANYPMVRGIEVLPADCTPPTPTPTPTQPSNTAPTVANPIADVTLQSGSNPAVMNIDDVFTDAEDDDSSLVLTIMDNSNPSLVVPKLDDGTLTLDPASGATGLAEITVRATDSGGLFRGR